MLCSDPACMSVREHRGSERGRYDHADAKYPRGV